MWWGAVAGYALAIFIVSIMPVEPGLPAVPHLDKAAHLCVYGLFTWIFVQAIRAHRLREREYLVLAWVFATSYGLLMELFQAMVPWRSPDLMDAAANALGALIGVCVGQRIPQQRLNNS